MRWNDIGIVISTQKYTDKNVIISALTHNHGRRCGMIKIQNKNQNMIQIGNVLSIEWSSKLESNLGYFKCELLSSVLQYCLDDPLKALSIAALTSILAKVLPENENHIKLFNSLSNFINILKYSKNWPQHYVASELQLLAQTGFALNLEKCAKYYVTDDLKFISPRTGMAVSATAARGYENKLFPLTPMLLNAYHNIILEEEYSLQEFSLTLQILWYFLKKHLLTDLNRDVSQYRKMMMQHLNYATQAIHLVSDD